MSQTFTGFTGQEKIGEIVTEFPHTSNVFKAYNIDFCCGGNRSLSLAIRQQNLNEAEVLEQLNKVVQETLELKDSQTDWREAPFGTLINHIVSTHHAYLQKELPLLSDFTTKIFRVHGPIHPELGTLHKLFHSLKMELDQHLIKEEEIVFPLIKAYEEHPTPENLEKALAALNELEKEHEEAGNLLKEMRHVTGHYTLPEGACRTYTLTFQKLEELESDLFQHIHLENNILFPRVESLKS